MKRYNDYQRLYTFNVYIEGCYGLQLWWWFRRRILGSFNLLVAASIRNFNLSVCRFKQIRKIELFCRKIELQCFGSCVNLSGSNFNLSVKGVLNRLERLKLWKDWRFRWKIETAYNSPPKCPSQKEDWSCCCWKTEAESIKQSEFTRSVHTRKKHAGRSDGDFAAQGFRWIYSTHFIWFTYGFYLIFDLHNV